MSVLFLAIPLTIFVLFVAPIWLWLHYSSRQQRGGQLSQQDVQHLTQLTQDARRMQDRIRALEEILDAEHPHWRES
ncbi:envelope stress response membrane protein PspB [Chimaeribacter arupi]|jgi:phage shock protein B|uniref:Envelope stress response membrane protein PspB n=3 Tax=Yersiniaceae TaxID=1903411 RepID=A0A2N5ESV1_9GAMM|nr:MULTISPECIES: envelope stress response membrane protein PspB [Yersiniaceae]MBS0970102.1 envelope stress response membrane protein PspB [Nissabacter archeti]MDV5140136.1 envelope stress response membrane protein PspB [Chimaeribacter arupi]PLR40129.1 envelope stress response membrane protein PspB [Chimaeribacter arupi]PLR41626.1 envelope stress response membrane protein PspB [Chimaeribacter californicus]PLR46865.1 envelope stress response membrane protein PspB [Chimaeribacter arupi]